MPRRPETKTHSSPTRLKLAADVEQALNSDAAALAAFDALVPSHQRDYLRWIDEAKKDATRQARIQKTLAILVEKAK